MVSVERSDPTTGVPISVITRARLLACLALPLMASSSPAMADCPEPTPISILEFAEERGESVFVGEVIQGSGRSNRARLSVSEVWTGPDLEPVVLVRTGPEQLPWPMSQVFTRMSSVDAELNLGQQYLVATHGDFATDLCSSMVADAEVLAAAPTDARPPVDGASSGHELGVFDTALGLVVVLAGLAVGALLWVGRRLDRRGIEMSEPVGRRALRGAVAGAAVGLVGAAVGELATEATRQLYPTDVAIVGFTMVLGAPSAAVAGAIMWWRGRPSSGAVRLALAASPVVLVAVWQVFVQWSAQ